MKIISFHSFGDADQLYFTEASEPKANEYQVVVKIKATALNRADILSIADKSCSPQSHRFELNKSPVMHSEWIRIKTGWLKSIFS